MTATTTRTVPATLPNDKAQLTQLCQEHGIKLLLGSSKGTMTALLEAKRAKQGKPSTVQCTECDEHYPHSEMDSTPGSGIRVWNASGAPTGAAW